LRPTTYPPLLPLLAEPPEGEAFSFGPRTISYRQLAHASTSLAGSLAPGSRVAVWATPTPEACVAVVATLLAGAVSVPLNPKLGETELAHILTDSEPALLLCAPGAELPAGTKGLTRVEVGLAGAAAALPPEELPDAPALILYTSGTTGPPKGVVLPRRAIASNLDALYGVWEWTAGDVLVHALPLFHVHGLVLGVLGPLRLGGRFRHVGHFSPEAIAAELERGATMVFGVPTMYHRLADEADAQPRMAEALRRARLLVSGSAPLRVRDHNRIELATGQRIVERYGLSETLMNCAARASGPRTPGYVGPPLPGVDVRLVGEDGSALEGEDDETIGEIAVRGPNLFLEYLNRPDATAEAIRDGWFYTGDLGVRGPAGIRIIGRKSTDLIKTGGYRVGAGEVEACLLEHPEVVEVAVTGEPDEDLGERIVAWVVPRGAQRDADELAEHVARLLTPHKRPRAVRFVDELPRNEMGKVRKSELGGSTPASDFVAERARRPGL
jgi:malonyl-CoA/methylmalonyl-CoA synthetase